MGIIYQAKNIITGKSYVGQTIKELAARKRRHHYVAKNGSDTYFHNALRKYGEEGFEWSILAQTTILDDLNLLETRFIEKVSTLAPNGYNLTTGGKNKRYSKISRIKMSAARKGKKHTEATKAKIGAASLGNKNCLGRKHTKTTKAKMRVAQLGEKSHMFGKKHTEATKTKLSIAHKGKKHTEATKTKIGAASIGEKNPSAKLNGADVLMIKKQLKHGISGITLAKKFNISQATISAIKTRKAWKTLTNKVVLC